MRFPPHQWVLVHHLGGGPLYLEVPRFQVLVPA